MTKSQAFRIVLGTWSALGQQAGRLRFEVFVKEQQVPPEEEIDALDEHCLHALAFSLSGDGDAEPVAVATGRLLPDGHIGRMAVSRAFRKQGAGHLVLLALMDAAREKGFDEVALGAQLHARKFYAKYGFVEQGEVFLDANIPHILMKACL